MTGIPADVATLTDLLRWRAVHQPDRIGYRFLPGTGDEAAGWGEELSLTYAQLDRRAQAIGARLREAGAVDGARVMLLLPPGLDYVAAFFGCLYAAAIAVPAYPPDPLQLRRSLPRLAATMRDASPAFAVSTAVIQEYLTGLAGEAPEIGMVRWLAVDQARDAAVVRWSAPPVQRDATAMLQYTSGSTAAPRGVMISHANLLHNSELIRRLFRTSPDSRGVSWLPPYHDMGLIGGLIQPLYAGFPVVLTSPLDFLARPLGWLELISRFQATVSGGPNFAYDLCVRKSTPPERTNLDLSCWQVAFNGAEPVRAHTLERFTEAFAPAGFRPAAFLPCYGLAEATLIVSAGSAASTAGHVEPGALQDNRVVPGTGATTARLTSCGPGADDQRIAIVDPETARACPADRVGEIWLSGPSVAAGYWGRPDETEQVFRARVAESGDGPFLRTGDLGYIRDGELVVTGRHKDLIIIRGRNHYAQDIELTAQQADSSLRPGGAAAFLVQPAGQDEQLVLVHEVTRQAGQADVAPVASRIRKAVSAEHGIQVRTVVLVPAGALPKTSSGKVQRRLCRAQLTAGELPVIATSDVARAGAAPAMTVSGADVLAAQAPHLPRTLRTYLREQIAAACGTEAGELSPGRSLLAAGMDSLAAQQLRQSVESDLGVRLPLPEILSGATVDQVADHLAGQLGDRRVAAASPGHVRAARPEAASVAALSYGQRSLWVLHQMAPDSAAHTNAVALRLSARLDRAAVGRALDSLAARHPALRTTFTTRDGEPVQVIHPAGQMAYEEHDTRAIGDDELAELLAGAVREPFRLAAGPLLRTAVYSRPDGHDVILFAAHHIVADFWSMTILAREFWAAYAEPAGGPAATLAEPAATHLDMAGWQESLVSGPAGEELARYWDEQLGDGVPPLRLPGLGASTSSRGGSHDFELSEELAGRLRRRAGSEGVTLYVLLLAAYQALLHRYTGQDDLVIGTPLAARSRREFAGVVGYCMNPVIIRSHAASGHSFRQLLAQAQGTVLGALEHQDYPMTLLAERHGIVRSGRPLFDTMFVFNRPPDGDDPGVGVVAGPPGVPHQLGSVRAERLSLPAGESAFPLEVTVTLAGRRLHGTVRYRADVLDDPAATRLADQFTTVLEAVCADPDLAIGGLLRAEGDERTRILRDWNATAGSYDIDACVPQLIERQAGRTPDALAVVAGERRLTYRELNEQANRLAYYLRALGVGPQGKVGVCLERSPELMVTLLAVLKAGGAYVPVDPLNPAQRIAAVLADADVTCTVTTWPLAGKLPLDHGGAVLLDADGPDIARCPAGNLAPAAAAGDLAYVIYTSGSAGAPKGVEIPHRALTNYCRFAADYFGLGHRDVVLQFASAGFDTSAEEIYPALSRGATLVLRTDAMLATPAGFLAACAAAGITVLDLPTAYWHELAAGIERDTIAVPHSLRLVIIGGEQALSERVAAWHARVGPRVRLVNTYGPTEATIAATRCDLTAPGGPPGAPIGRPVANVRVYLLDDQCQPVRVGPVGEIYVGGAGVARGYLNQPVRTAEHFVPDPYGPPGARLYRTGDLGRYRADGTLEFAGRADRQVKVRGMRVELGEIEAALRRHPQVTDAAVVYRGDAAVVAAYVLAPEGSGPADDQLRAFVRAWLPEHMVPASITAVSAFPRTRSGKIDYAALRPAQVSRETADLPRTPDERLLADLWKQVLGLPEVGAHDDFFALGGHSLLAVKMLAQVSRRTGRELPIRAVFENPTLASLARLLPDAPQAGSGTIARAPRDQPLPLSFPQERVWFLQYLEPGTTAYNVPRALRIRGAVDPLITAGALGDLEIRHEILRTTFPDVDGVPVQRIHEPRGIPFRFLDLSGLTESERAVRARDIVAAEGRKPFDMAEGPLLRVTLIRLAPGDHILASTEHHLLHDGWAQGVAFRDFLEFYEARVSGRAPRLPELPIQYADFAAWQRGVVRGQRLDELLDFWQRQLAGAPHELRLRTDRPRPRVRTSQGDQEILVIGGELGNAVREFSRENDVTLFMTMFAAFAVLLDGYSDQQDIVCATTTANRQRQETENLLGMIVNTILVRVDLTDNPSFRTLLGRVRHTCLEAYAHQDMPFEKLVERLRPDRDLGRMPLFQVMFSLLNALVPQLGDSSLTYEVIDTHNQSAKFDLNVVVVPHADYQVRGSSGSAADITVLTEYSTDLFDAGTIRQMLGHFATLLSSVVSAPDQPVGWHLALLGLRPR